MVRIIYKLITKIDGCEGSQIGHPSMPLDFSCFKDKKDDCRRNIYTEFIRIETEVALQNMNAVGSALPKAIINNLQAKIGCFHPAYCPIMLHQPSRDHASFIPPPARVSCCFN